MTKQPQTSNLFRNIAEVIDDMIAGGFKPAAVLMQPHRRERLRESRLKYRKNQTDSATEYTILGLPVIPDVRLTKPFVVLTETDLKWRQ